MLQSFDNETENGKLYISYPMVEALRDYKPGICGDRTDCFVATTDMKEYKNKKPIIVIGGRVGSFLGEYLAGGRIIVLGQHHDFKPLVGSFPCAGMHGGKIFLHGDVSTITFPTQVHAKVATQSDWDEIEPYITRFCELFKFDKQCFKRENFTVITPDSTNPYKQLYIAN